jgi:glutamyl-tRNA synthetase
MGWTAPAFAHIPLIHGPDGAKLSKRHGALGVDAYRAMGYLPAALRNYLVRLGWSQGDKEFFSLPEMIEAFDLAQVHRSPARFDFAKLENMNGHYLRATPDEELFDVLVDSLPYLEGGEALARALDEEKRTQLRAALPGLKARARTLNELLDGSTFIFAKRPLALDEKAEKLLTPEARTRLGALTPKLAALTEWSAATTEAVVRDLSVELGVKLGDLAQPLRAALTGRTTSPGIFDVLEILGRAESLARISDQSAG